MTSFGRNYAQGRVSGMPPPDPAEDDGREILYWTLQDLANIIGRDYPTPFEVFSDSGIARGDIDFTNIAVSAAAYARHHLYAKATGSSKRRRELRHFIGAWLDNQLHIGPTDDERDSIEYDFARQAHS